MKVTQWLVAATLLFTLGGVAQAQDVTQPDKGTVEYTVGGNIIFNGDSSWNLQGSWGPFVNPNIQWGLKASVFDSDQIETSGSLGPFINYYFPSPGSTTLPYVGAGVGFSFGETSSTIWDIHGGIKYLVSPTSAIFAELQWQNSNDVVFSNGDDNQVQLNLGYSLFR